MRRGKFLRWRLVAWPCSAIAAAAAAPARAAGGHFDVDDASVLAPGHCQYELWANRAPRADATGLHLGPSCRVGPFEIGLDVDRVSVGGDPGTSFGPHLKWVHPLGDRVSVGALFGTSFDLNRGGRPVQAFYFPATWNAAPGWAVNVNFGWDRSDGTAMRRYGASAEWSPVPVVTVIGERVRTGGAMVSRLGTRFALGTGLSLDLSLAHAGAFAGRLYTVGLNHDFAR